MYIHIYTFIYMYMPIYVYTHTHTYIYIYIYIRSICGHICTYVCICIYVDIHINIYQYILTIYMLTNVNLLNLNNNLLMFFVCVVIKITVLLSTATRDQITVWPFKVLK